jgi:predicted house-cleaning noncanonical NTP pyrophosphatase (MazG superfamily)
VVEYSPSEVKLSIVGHGHATKEQVAEMLKRRLQNETLAFATGDASDGLALAVCHVERVLRAPALASKSLEIRREQRRPRGLAESLGLQAGQITERRLSAASLRSKKS